MREKTALCKAICTLTILTIATFLIARRSHGIGSNQYELTLEFIPMQTPGAWLIRVEHERLRAIRYQPTRYLVNSVCATTLSQEQRAQLLNHDQDFFYNATGTHRYTGAGLLQGDQFNLKIQKPSGSATWLGFVSYSPEPVNLLVAKFYSLARKLSCLRASGTFLRSVSIEDWRFERLSKRKVPFNPIESTFSRLLQAHLQESCRRMREFIPLRPNTASALEARLRGKHQFYGLYDSRPFEFQYFRSQNQSKQNRRRYRHEP